MCINRNCIKSVQPMMYLYYLEEFSIEEISYIQQMDENHINQTIQDTKGLVESIFHIDGKHEVRDVMVKILSCNVKYKPLSEEQSKRIYANIMKSVACSKLN